MVALATPSYFYILHWKFDIDISVGWESSRFVIMFPFVIPAPLVIPAKAGIQGK